MVGGLRFCQVSSLTCFIIASFSLNNCYCDLTETSTQASTSKPDELRKPKLLVFNLDMVIWPFRVESDVVTPVKKHKKSGHVTDFLKKPLGVYADAVDALNSLYLQKFRMAAISDSPDVETNVKLLFYFNLNNYFPIQEIFGGPKRDHLKVIHSTTQIPYNEIFFFDKHSDELDAIRKMGVFVIELTEGLEINDFRKAMERYNKMPLATNSTSTVVS